MKPKRNILFFSVALILLLMILSLMIFKEAPEDAPLLRATVGRRSFSVSVEAVGELDAARSTVLLSQIRGDQGKIISIIDEGTRVKKGDVVVRLDPTPFEEKVAQLSAKVLEDDAIVTARDQALNWEKIQAEQEVQAADFDLKAAQLDLVKLKKGDGPLELVRLEGAAQEARQDWEEKQGYIADLQTLKMKGFANPTEIANALNKVDEAKKLYEVANRKYESYRDYVLPALIEKAKAQVQRAKMNLEQSKKASGFRVGKAMAALRQAQEKLKSAKAALQAAQIALERTVICAPIPGIVVLPEAHRGGSKRKPRIGDVVWQNQPLVYLPDVSEMIVRTQIREIDLHKVTIGKPAVVRVDAYPDLILSGQVQSIGVLAKARDEGYKGDKYFSVLIAVREEDQRLRPGMTAKVEIQCNNVHEVLTVPIHALFEEKGRWYCYKDVKASFEKQEVLLGVCSNDWAQIIAGLKEGDVVAFSQPPAKEIVGLKELERPRQNTQ
jgi:HlyD family secretion protein